MIPALELIMTLWVQIGAPLEVGEVGSGRRRMIPITVGRFEGPGLRGEIELPHLHA